MLTRHKHSRGMLIAFSGCLGISQTRRYLKLTHRPVAKVPHSTVQISGMARDGCNILCRRYLKKWSTIQRIAVELVVAHVVIDVCLARVILFWHRCVVLAIALIVLIIEMRRRDGG